MSGKHTRWSCTPAVFWGFLSWSLHLPSRVAGRAGLGPLCRHGRRGCPPRPASPQRGPCPPQGYLTDLLREVQPTMFPGSPWVWDRMMDGLRTSQLAATALCRRVDEWAMDVGLSTNKKRMFG